MFWKVVILIALAWLVFYIYHRKYQKKEHEFFIGTVVDTEFVDFGISSKYIITAKIEKKGFEKIVKADYYGRARACPSKGQQIRLCENENGEYEYEYNLYGAKIIYMVTLISVPIILGIAVALKIFLPR